MKPVHVVLRRTHIFVWFSVKKKSAKIHSSSVLNTTVILSTKVVSLNSVTVAKMLQIKTVF